VTSIRSPVLRGLEGIRPAEDQRHAAALTADGQLLLERRYEAVVPAAVATVLSSYHDRPLTSTSWLPV